ncbi:Uncharacterized protein BM_BM17417 [Brugia malayi]|uniref:C2H2-type domain-containing protein n=1 Tax=Brugia malayi TaxID=6279 RepID=A0A4E9F834_BRUMA|nr:Uncharacterized protein BM_BM17417 [Brugia malayi]VIO92480.1 Uncharacterized protein BM_BM17417 [Brugia malayi]
MFFTIPMTPIIWLNLLLCIISEKNKTFPIINPDKSDEIITYTTHSGTSNSFDILDYNSFEPLFGSEFPSDPSQLIDFDQLSEIEDISSKESIPEITNAPHPGFSNSHGLLGHTNLGSLLGSYTDSNRNVWRDANPIYFHQLTLSPDDTTDQHGNAEQNNMGKKHFSDNLIVRDYRENEGSETNTQSGTSSPLNVDTDDIITYMHLPGSQQNAVPIYFHQLTLSSDDTSSQHGNTKESNIDNKHFLNSLSTHDCRGNTSEGSETDNKKYICHYPGCTVITKDYKEYITHKKSHGQPFIYECKVPSCGRTFHHGSSFRNHKQTHEPHPQCEGCGKFFTSRNQLLYNHQKHCQTNFRERSYECLYPGCTMITKNYKEYVIHKKTHGQPFIYECRVSGCERIFQHKSSFCNHKQTHEPHHQCKQGYECHYPGCAVISKSYNDNIKHKETHNGPFIYECKVPSCGRAFHHESSFCNHKQTHEPRPQCEGCGKFFISRNGLHCHKKSCKSR